MAEEHSERPAELSATERAQQVHTKDYTSEGRYIPYSGGSTGWYDNSLVPESEMPNNYQLYRVMDLNEVRMAQFERVGDHFQDRRGNRKRVMAERPARLSWGSGSERGHTRDLSLFGARVQFFEGITLQRGNTVTLVLMDENGEQDLISVECQVAWVELLGNLRPLWNVGVAFTDLKGEARQQLQEMLGV